MTLSRLQKTLALLLAIYWPAIFIFAHVPVPEVIREADVSDKTLHFLAYLILVFLLWFTVSDDRKVNWRTARPWCVFLTIAVYGIVDEWLQRYVAGRSCDALDLVADLASGLTGLLMFSVLSFWPAGLLVTALAIFGIANVSKTDLSDVTPAANTLFYVIAYALFTVFWVRCIGLFLPRTSLRINKMKWLAAALAAPLGLVLAVEISSELFGRGFSWRQTIVSCGSMAATVAVSYLWAARHEARCKDTGR